jgi:Shikimate kinase
MRNIFLIGYMGCGKTTIGRLLADDLGMQFVDLDTFIETRFHKTIDALFQEHGEDRFRTIEMNALKEIAQFENIIVSTGGGAPCFFNNLEMMKENGTVVYLKASVDELLKRLWVGKYKRPLLKEKNKEEMSEYITTTLEKRESFYSQADYIYRAERQNTENEVKAIVERLKTYFSS